MEMKVGAAWILISILCFSTLHVSWLELSGSTEFTSGKPERSELIIEIEVDSTMETQSIQIEKATPFVLWMMVRDSVENESINEDLTEGQNDSTAKGNEDDVGIIDRMQSFTTLAACMVGFIALLCALQGRIQMRWVFSLWSVGFLLFICLPIAWMVDVGQTLDSGLPEEQGPNESEAFVHVNSDTHSELVFIGIEFHFEGDGWDLGMIEEENRNATIEEAPDDENGTHDAHIGWDGEVSLRYGDSLTIWLAIGVLLLSIFFYERHRNQSILSDEAE
jgi:hypothetical protein